MKIYLVLSLLAVVFFAGCGANQQTAPPTSAESPSRVLQRYVEASQKGDIATMKSLLSKSSLRFIEEKGRPMNVTVDDVLRRETEVKLPGGVETRNERIEGDAATVDVKNPLSGEFDLRYPFVREDGAWKLARDRYIEEEERRMMEEINRKLANSANSVNKTVPPANVNGSVNNNLKFELPK
jgi:hypothetical protein